MKSAAQARRRSVPFTLRREELAELSARLVMAALLGRARIFSALSPFGIAFVAASGGGVAGIVSLLGAILGTLTAGGPGWAVKYIAIITVVWACVHFFARSAPRWFPMAAAFGVTLIIGAVYAWDSGWEVAATAMWVVESFFAGGLVWFYSSALSPWSDNAPRSVRSGRAASLILLTATLLISLASVNLFGILSIGRALAVIAVMFVSLRGGLAMGCVSAAALGASMDLAWGGAPFFTLSYTLSALIAGVFSRDGRLVFTLSWVASAALSVLWFWQFHRWLPALYETFAASVIFMLLPDALLARLAVFLPKEPSGGGYVKAREYTRERVDRCAMAFRGLYDAMRSRDGDGSDAGPAQIYDRACDKVCRDCPSSARCWQEEYVETLDIMNSLTPVLTKKGFVDVGDVPERFASRCARAQLLCGEITNEARSYLSRRAFRARLKESRGAAYGQYMDISRILSSLASELGGELQVEPELEKKLRKYLRGLAMDAETAVFRLRGGRLRAEITSQNTDLLKRDKSWLENLSAVLETRLCAVENAGDGGRIILMEAEPLAVTVGKSAARKSGERVSGDRCVYFRTDEGILYVILSDGMGSGPDAAGMSAEAVEITERFLKAGVGPDLTVSILSSLCLLRDGDGLESATVDLLRLDMFSGEASIYKYGAAPSYIRHGASVKRVGAGSLPMGIAAREKTPAVKLTVKPGDIILMASDGVVTGGDDKLLRQAMAGARDSDVKALARRVVDAAARATASADDMTVIALAVEKRG